MFQKKAFEKKKREKILKEFAHVVGTNSSKARSLIKKLNYNEDPYLLQCIAQTYFDESLFNDDGSQREFFEGRKLRLAERYIIKAYKINENCIDVLWVLGKVRKAFRQFDLAIYCYKRLIKLGSKNISKYDNCTNRTLVQIKVNDSRFQLYRTYHDMGEFRMANRYLSTYKTGLNKGIGTLYRPLEKYLLD